MVSRSGKSRPQRRPPSTPEEAENQLIAAAVDLAGRQLTEGTATSQVITHFLKLASSREQLEQRKLEQDIGYTQAKIEAMAAANRIESLYDEAIKAMREYQGQDVDDLEIL
jgi:hypothetical protein